MILLGKKEKENCIRELGDRMLKIAAPWRKTE